MMTDRKGVCGGSRYDTIAASITRSSLWRSCTVFKLTINMRLLRPGLTTAEAQQARSFVGGNLVTLAILLL